MPCSLVTEVHPGYYFYLKLPGTALHRAKQRLAHVQVSQGAARKIEWDHTPFKVMSVLSVALELIACTDSVGCCP